MNRINRRILVVFAAAAAVPLLAGCYNGFNAQTNVQPPSGDGASTQVGNLMVRSATWVRSAADPRTMTLSSNFVNAGVVPDELVSVTTAPRAFAVGITGNQLPVGPMSEIRVGFDSDKYINAYGLDVNPSGYLPTTFNFKVAGTVTVPVLTVPPDGYYSGITPNPPAIAGGAKAPAPTGSPTASRTGTASPTARPSSTASASPTPTP